MTTKEAGVWRPVLLGAVGIYLVGPIALVLVLSFGRDDVLRFPPELFSLRWYREFFGSEAWIGAAVRSVTIGAGAAALATVAGTMAAFAFVRSRFPGKRVLEALVIAPLIIPEIVLAAGGYSLFIDLHLVGSYAGVAVMHAVLGVPYVVIVVSGALRRVDPRLEFASMSLGADRLTTFRKVTMPAIAPAVLTGALFAFLVSFDNVVISIFLVGQLDPTLPINIFSGLEAAVSPVVAAVSSLQVVLSILLLLQVSVLESWQSARTRAPAPGATVGAKA
jgi:ABC-type spermidine/putrescine transport system permease subunit II